MYKKLNGGGRKARAHLSRAPVRPPSVLADLLARCCWLSLCTKTVIKNNLHTMADEEPNPAAATSEEAPPAGDTSAVAEAAAEDGAAPAGSSNGDVIGSAAIRPVFLGNLKTTYTAPEVEAIFTRPILPPGTEEGTFQPFDVDRVDLKRGYCFLFLKDATSQAQKESAERFVEAINGM